MSNLAAANVSYSLLNQRKMSDSRSMNRVQISFGDGALTYPAGGIPLTIAKMGCPTVIESMSIVSAGTSGYRFQYDRANNKLVVLQGTSHTHDLLLKNAAVADGATTRVNAGANLLGANTGSDVTITGGGANGGVVAKNPGALSEASAVALAAQTLEVEVIGW